MGRTPSTAGVAPEEAQTNEAEAPVAQPGANVIVLAEDVTLLELLKHALEGRQRVWRADNALHAADLLVAADSGILFLDAALLTHETPELVDKLHSQFPDVPIVVTGRRDDEAELGQRISSGVVFRFLHKPVSAERVRNFIDGAARRASGADDERARPAKGKASPSRAPRAPRLPRIRLDAERRRQLFRATSLLVLLALVGWGIAALVEDQPWKDLSLPSLPTASPARSATPQQAPAAAPRPAPARAAEQTETGRLLSAAGIALSQGRFAEPSGDNAIELYRAVLRLDPINAEARQGLRSTAEGLLQQVQRALIAGDPDSAATALDQARSADPTDPRLAYYSNQLELARERARTSAQLATGAAIAAADHAESRQLAQFLTVADTRMKQGKLTGGPDSAEAYVLQARDLAPDAPGVQQGLNALSGRMLLAASEAKGRGDLAAATNWLDQAETLGVDGPSIARLRAEIASTQVASVQEDRSRLLALANQRIAQGRLLSPAGDSARHYIDLLRAADPNYAGLSDTESLLASALIEQARAMIRSHRYTEATQLLDSATAAGARAADVAAARKELGSSLAVTAAAGQVLPESALKRLSHDAPQYPKRALERGIEGWVNVEFTVAADGTTRDIEVTAAEPTGVFDQAVADAIGTWRYRPRIVAGHPVDQRVAARLRFELSGG